MTRNPLHGFAPKYVTAGFRPGAPKPAPTAAEIAARGREAHETRLMMEVAMHARCAAYQLLEACGPLSVAELCTKLPAIAPPLIHAVVDGMRSDGEIDSDGSTYWCTPRPAA